VQLYIEQRPVTDGIATIALSGRLLLGQEGAELENIVRRLIGEGVRKFLFDFTELTHIDSTGIGRCIASLNMIMQVGGQLAIYGATGQVREGFRITRLDSVFHFAEDAGSAEASLR
jgi:anti-anti-sigma factor